MITQEAIDKKIERVQEEIALAEKCMAELSQRKQELEVTIGQLKNIKTEQIGRARHSELYWYIDDLGQICSKIESDSLPDEYRYEIGNYYLTSEDANRAEKQIRLFRLLDRFTRQNGWTDEAWKNLETNKTLVSFHYNSESVQCNTSKFIRRVNQVYFISDVVAQQAVKKYRDLIMEVMEI